GQHGDHQNGQNCETGPRAHTPRSEGNLHSARQTHCPGSTQCQDQAGDEIENEANHRPASAAGAIGSAARIASSRSRAARVCAKASENPGAACCMVAGSAAKAAAAASTSPVSSALSAR